MAKRKDPNYDFESQVVPERNMGAGSYANMPENPMFLSFGKEHDRRDGIINSFTTNLDSVSDIDENQIRPMQKEARRQSDGGKIPEMGKVRP